VGIRRSLGAAGARVSAAIRVGSANQGHARGWADSQVRVVPGRAIPGVPAASRRRQHASPRHRQCAGGRRRRAPDCVRVRSRPRVGVVAGRRLAGGGGQGIGERARCSLSPVARHRQEGAADFTAVERHRRLFPGVLSGRAISCLPARDEPLSGGRLRLQLPASDGDSRGVGRGPLHGRSRLDARRRQARAPTPCA
jgi:hypothetical protein